MSRFYLPFTCDLVVVRPLGSSWNKGRSTCDLIYPFSFPFSHVLFHISHSSFFISHFPFLNFHLTISIPHSSFPIPHYLSPIPISHFPFPIPHFPCSVHHAPFSILHSPFLFPYSPFRIPIYSSFPVPCFGVEPNDSLVWYVNRNKVQTAVTNMTKQRMLWKNVINDLTFPMPQHTSSGDGYWI